VRSDFKDVLDLIRGRLDAAGATGAARFGPHRAVRLQQFLGSPAIVAGMTVASPSETAPQANQEAPVILSVKFIDDDILADIGSRLQLLNLRRVGAEPLSADLHVFELAYPNGPKVARFAWTPRRPGTEIVQNALPFVAVALGSFALLAGLMLRHVRRTSATI